MSKEESLESLKNEILRDLVCPLKAEATNLVFGRGSVHSEIFVIGEAPGKKEDESGIPFVGSAGKNLARFLEKSKRGIDDVYIANILKYRPPKNRNPTIAEIESHTPYLVRQISIIKPKIIISLGNFATKFVLSGFDVSQMKKIQGISEIHGQVFRIIISDREYIVVPMYHPAAVLYKRSLQEVVEKDFENLQNILE